MRAAWVRAAIAAVALLGAAALGARDVAECGLKALFAFKPVAVYGALNKALVLTAQLAPRFLVRLIAKRVLFSVGEKS